jgi:hypothetical protein
MRDEKEEDIEEGNEREEDTSVRAPVSTSVL